MNPKIPVNNSGAMPLYVAGLMIPPGETRHFDPEQVPLHLRPAPVEVDPEAPPDPLVALLDELLPLSVKDIKARLPDLDDATLQALAEAEAAAKSPRSTLLGACAEEQMARAEAREAAAAAAGAGAT